MIKYFKGSLIITVIGLALSFGVGELYDPTLESGLKALVLCAILAVLEISLSFDNAVVNATVLKTMTPLWQKRFLTWGILVAVFGMRIVFPLAIVSIMANLNPWEALIMAATKPSEYAEVMMQSHVMLAGFGGSFLMMVALKYFFDDAKEVHWIQVIERPIAKLGKVQAIEVGFCLLAAWLISKNLSDVNKSYEFIVASIWGTLVFVLVDGISEFLHLPENASKNIEKASVASFLYLEVLDASFSFDGVIGAFALTQNIFLIAIGLGIGAFFVRSMTIMLVEKETLSQFEFLEHGAFYAIGALAASMWIGAIVHIPEVFTGLIGAVLIGLSLFSSVKLKKAKAT